MYCEEKLQLITSNATAVAAYYATVAELECRMIITASGELYARLRQKIEAARAVCDATRKELDDHEVSHKR